MTYLGDNNIVEDIKKDIGCQKKPLQYKNCGDKNIVDGIIRLNIEPVSKPRMTARDRWGTNKRPAIVRYHQFKDDLRVYGLVGLPSKLDVTFYITMPKSWSDKRKKNADGKPHQQRPDIDNFCKALMDAVDEDDSHIYELHARKLWAYTGYIEIKQQNDYNE